MPICQIIDDWAKQDPDTHIFIIDDKYVCLEGVCAQKKQIQLWFERNVTPADHSNIGIAVGGFVVAVMAHNAPSFLSGFIASIDHPNAIVLCSPSWSIRQFEDALGDIKPDVILCDSRLDGLDKITPFARDNNIPVLDLAHDLNIADCDLICEQKTGEIDLDRTFLIGFTSGTTSKPKAFRRSLSSWHKSLELSRKAFSVTCDMTTLAPGPLAHGLTLYAMVETLSAQAQFISMTRFDPIAAVRLIKRHNVKRLVLVPSMLFTLCEALDDICLYTVLSVVCAGAKLDHELLKRAQMHMPNAQISEYYGASELGFVSLAHRVNGQDKTSSDVGTAFPSVILDIRDDCHIRCDAGETGTIWVRSELVCDGYIGADMHNSFMRHGEWCSVGDFGYLDDQKRLYVQGRKGDMIVSGGNNIYPALIEQLLLRHSNIQGAIIVGIDDVYLGARVVAVIEGSDLNVSNILADLCEKVAKYMLPKRILSTKTWPMTESGKISRGQIKDWIEQGDKRLHDITPT